MRCTKHAEHILPMLEGTSKHMTGPFATEGQHNAADSPV